MEQKTNTSYSVVVGNEKSIRKGNGVGQSKKRMTTRPRGVPATQEVGTGSQPRRGELAAGVVF